MKRLKILCIGTLLTVAPTNADFTLRPNEANENATDNTPASDTPSQPQSDVKSQSSSHVPVRKHTSRGNAPVAQGFGEQIPLSFAVQQIVPPAIKIRIGRGIDPATLVDWKGGHEWPFVLRQAIRPLKLRLAVHPTTATIYDPQNQ